MLRNGPRVEGNVEENTVGEGYVGKYSWYGMCGAIQLVMGVWESIRLVMDVWG